MARNSTITVTLKGDNKHLRKAFDGADDRAAQFGRNIGRIAAQASAAIALVTVALGAAAVKQASDLQESANAVAVTFGKEADDIAKLAESAAQGVGLSASEFNGFAVQFSAFAANIAGAGGDVSDVIDDIATRAADFASVMNLDVAEAAQIFQSGLAGETEPLRKFGIDLSAAAVAAYAVANGIADSAGEMTEAQKVQARFGLLMKQTNKTAGDFANTSGSLANQQRILGATVKDLGAKVGASLLPALEKLATLVAERVVPFLERNLPSAIDAVKRAIDASLPTLTAIYEGFRTLVDFFRSNQPAMIGLIAAITVGLAAWAVSAGLAAAATLLAIAPFIAAAAAIGVLVAGVVYAYQNFETFRQIVDTVRAWIVDTLWPAIQAVAQGIADEFAALAGWVKTHWSEIRETIEGVIKAVLVIIESTIAIIRAAWETWGNTLVSFISKRWEQIKTLIQAAIDIVRGIINTVTALIRGDWEGVWDGIKQTLSGVWDAIRVIVQAAIDNVKLILQLGWDAIGGYVSDTWDSITGTVGDGIDDIVGFVTGLPGRVAGALGNGFDSIWDNFKSVINRIIDAWNGLRIPGITIPGFDPPGPGRFPSFTTPSIGVPPIQRLHTGGIIQGREGREVPIMGLGGEGVFTQEQMAAMGGPSIGLQIIGDVRLDDIGVETVARRIEFSMLSAA